MKKKNTLDAYLKAIKKADREISLGTGWKAKDRAHKNKKIYSRKNYKIIYD